MRNHTLNLFRVLNLADLKFSYRLVSQQLPFIKGQEDLYNKQLIKISQKIASWTKGPAAIIKRNGKFFIAIPADRNLEHTKVDLNPLVATIGLLPEVYEVHGNNIQPGEMDLVNKFLEAAIGWHLSSHKDLWRLSGNQFFNKLPSRKSENLEVDIHEGFSFRLVTLDDGGIYVCLDLTSKYVDKNYLDHYVRPGNIEVMQQKLRSRKFLYKLGDNWYTCEIKNFAGKIADYNFIRNGQEFNLYEDIMAHPDSRSWDYKSRVKKEDLTVLYTYPGRTMIPHGATASLGKLIYSTNEPHVKSLHRYSIMDPAKRFDGILNTINNFFQGIKLTGQIIKIARRPVVEKVANFTIPELKFSNDRTLKVGHFSTGANTNIYDLASERKQLLLNNGILTKSGFDEQFLIVPDSMDRGLVEAFKRNAEAQLKKLAPVFSSFRVIRYKALEGQSTTYQIQEIEKTLRQQNAVSGFALFILPDLSTVSRQFINTIHDCFKNKFYPSLKLQCASASKIKSFFYATAGNGNGLEYRVPDQLKSKFKSYLFYLVMELLIVNRKWPFALSNNSKYDVYIGIDVHARYAGFTFFFKNGEQLYFHPELVIKRNRSQKAEKLKAPLLHKVLYENLKMFLPLYANNPNGIIIVRDGRSFGEEEKALQSVLNALSNDGLVNINTIESAVIDLHKQSAIPLRVVSQVNGHYKLENPIVGAYKLINNKEGFIYNTGFPFDIRGTAKPLHISHRYGNADFLKIMEDLFCQSMLAFSAPDKSNALPVTIKMIDVLLEPLTATYEVEQEEEDDQYAEIDIQNN